MPPHYFIFEKRIDLTKSVKNPSRSPLMAFRSRFEEIKGKIKVMAQSLNIGEEIRYFLEML